MKSKKKVNKLIHSISIENYRGFNDPQTFELTQSGNMTFLIGQNNSGKTLIAKVFSIISRINPAGKSIPEINLDNIKITDADYYNLNTANEIVIKLGLTDEFINELLTQFASPMNFRFEHLLKITKDFSLHLTIRKMENRTFKIFALLHDGTHFLYNYNTDDETYSYNDILDSIYNLNKESLDFLTITITEAISNDFLIFSPIRSFKQDDTSFSSGYELLSFLRNQDMESELMSVKNNTSKFLSKLNLDVPNDIQVSNNIQGLKFTFKNNLPLTSSDVGTGYTMIYILLMEIFRNSKKVIVIDEIESHLHPGLLRELIKILREIGTMQQFVIATHSPTVMESANENDHLYHFKKTNDKCIINKFYKAKDNDRSLRVVGNDLGIIPGDALLSNCVIWVEGPSEILWVRAWMKAYLPFYLNTKNKQETSILEGLHYSILMTGGTLIKHVDFDEENSAIEDIEEDFGLNVLRINPYPFVIIDSDNAQPGSEKHNRCLRIADQLRKQNQLLSWNKNQTDNITENSIHSIQNFWLLKGKELENYCHPQILKEFYTARSQKTNTKIIGIENVKEWNVYSESVGVGKLLEDQGLQGVQKDSGTIKHKNELAKYVFQHFSKKHFEDSNSELLTPNTHMLKDIRENLDKLFDYIFTVNNL